MTVAPAWDRVIGRRTGAPGPTLVVVGGVHGNEPAGLHAAVRVLDSLPDDIHGTFMVVAGNRRALTKRHRSGAADLNRRFTDEHIDRVRRYGPADDEDMELVELLDVFTSIEAPAFVLDLHTVSSPSPPFLVFEDTLAVRNFVRGIPAMMILGFEEELRGLLIDHLTQTRRFVCAAFEAGEHDDPRSVDIHEWAIRCALEGAGIHAADPEARERLRDAGGGWADRVFDVRHREPVSSETFRVLGDVRALDEVQADSILAQDGHKAFRAPISGRVVMPNRQPVKRPGDDGFFIVRRVDRRWLRVSAWFRKQRWVHAIIPHLPGVARCPDDPQRLRVDPRVAIVCKRQVFHLMGYRLWSHGRDVHLSYAERLLVGLWIVGGGIVRALLFIVTLGWLGRRRPDNEDWIVARRILDRS